MTRENERALYTGLLAQSSEQRESFFGLEAISRLYSNVSEVHTERWAISGSDDCRSQVEDNAGMFVVVGFHDTFARGTRRAAGTLVGGQLVLGLLHVSALCRSSIFCSAMVTTEQRQMTMLI